MREKALCPSCAQDMAHFGRADYYDETGKYSTDLNWCHHCDFFKRVAPHHSLVSHYNVASYVRLENEQKFLAQRQKFFDYLLQAIEPELHVHPGQRPHLLDFGSGYGHFLEAACNKGFDAFGVEINANLVNYTRGKGLVVFERIEDVHQGFDVVTMVDSLYCVEDPDKLIAEARRVLNDNGVLLARITNRNWILKFKKRLFNASSFGFDLGDATCGLSLKSVNKLLIKGGFLISNVLFRERGKDIRLSKRIIYSLTGFLATVTCGKIALAPGIILVARKHTIHSSEKGL